MARMPVLLIIAIILLSTPLASNIFPSFEFSTAASPINPPTLDTAAINASMRQVLVWVKSRVLPNGTATLQGTSNNLWAKSLVGRTMSYLQVEIGNSTTRTIIQNMTRAEHISASESVLYQLRNMVACKPEYTIPSSPRRTEISVKSLRANARPDRKVGHDQCHPEHASQPASQKRLF